MRIVLVFILITSLQLNVFSQKEDRNWVFGVNCGIDFNDLNNPVNFKANCNNLEANASISDSAGNLLFYLAYHGNSYHYPMEIRDANHNIIPNGDSIYANFSSSNGAIILPINNRYYIIYNSQSYNQYGYCGHCSNIFYTVIQKELNDSLVIIRKNIPLPTFYTIEEKIEAIKHANGVDWWIISNGQEGNGCNNRFHIFNVTVDSIYGAYNQDTGPDLCGLYGEIAASRDGSTIALATKKEVNSNIPLSSEPSLLIYDFDRCNGKLSFKNYHKQSNWLYGIEFSPSGRNLFFHVKKNNDLYIMQYDIITFSENIVYTFNNYKSLSEDWLQFELAPDNKIYIAHGIRDTIIQQYGQNLTVIENPDSTYNLVNVIPYGYYLGDSVYARFGLPNMPNYNLEALSVYVADAGEDVTICSEDTMMKGVFLGTTPVAGVQYTWFPNDSLIHPNSAQPFAYPSQTTTYYVTLFDSLERGGCNPRIDSVTVYIKNCALGVSENEFSELKIYPNPANDLIYIDGVKKETSFILYDCIGKNVINQTLQTGMNVLSVSSLSKGIYVYKISSQKFGKLIIR